MPKKIKLTPSYIKRIRDKLGMTQEQFAVRIGVSYVTVNRWENGRTKPSPLAEATILALTSD